MKRLLLTGLASLATASLALAAGTPLSEHGLSTDCAVARGGATVYSPGAGIPASGPGWIELRGLRREFVFTVGSETVGAPMFDFESGTFTQSLAGLETYDYGDGNVLYARDVLFITASFANPNLFTAYGTTLSGPHPFGTEWGTGVFEKALMSIRFRGTYQVFDDGSSAGEYTVEDGIICNVDWKALAKTKN